MTEDLQDVVILHILNGCTILGACRICDVVDNTFYSWKRKAKSGEEPYASFFANCRKAEEQFAASLLQAVRDHVGRDWRAALALYEKRFPDGTALEEEMLIDLTNPEAIPGSGGFTLEEVREYLNMVAQVAPKTTESIKDKIEQNKMVIIDEQEE